MCVYGAPKGTWKKKKKREKKESQDNGLVSRAREKLTRYPDFLFFFLWCAKEEVECTGDNHFIADWLRGGK